nr:hypothetical protein K-LCC10_0383 [Kaumoebavirus]
MDDHFSMEVHSLTTVRIAAGTTMPVSIKEMSFLDNSLRLHAPLEDHGIAGDSILVYSPVDRTIYANQVIGLLTLDVGEWMDPTEEDDF